MAENEINYDILMEKALKYVVVEALKYASENGLSETNHFYITFNTTHPGVRMDTALLNQYPENMTIVLQHQFANLMISENYFEVDLSFNNIPHSLRIPFEAITYFADPYARFALSFSEPINTTPKSEPIEQKVSGGSADIISIDAFRKK
ncbi:MAG: hypothetical protein IKK52_01085 [Alphaproteobacteria bacterium]|nr:hypothetical protein [Alphaproteobacteria bacterium]